MPQTMESRTDELDLELEFEIEELEDRIVPAGVGIDGEAA